LPLRRWIGRDDKSEWERVMRGFDHVRLSAPREPASVQLLRFAGNWNAPRHTQSGVEMVIVLSGGYRDEHGRYGVGDAEIGGSSAVHQPIADPEGCLCLSVWEGPVRVAGPLGWVVNRFLRI
jgi:putative transcriptional regulator